MALGCVGLVAGAGCAKTSKTAPGGSGATTTTSGAVLSSSPSPNGAVRLAITSPASGTEVKGNVVGLAVGVEGIKIVKPDGDTSGATGHLHVFVDREPTPAGAVIPKEAGIIHTVETTVPLSDLTPGDHFAWVVVGDGTHAPFDPPVQAKVTFSVTGG